MSQYSKDEIEEFRKKDIRISKSGVIQALIQSGVFTEEEIRLNITCNKDIKITDIADKYLKWIWEEKLNETKSVEVPVAKPVTWFDIAKEYALPIPTKEEENILDIVLSEYLNVANGKKIRQHVLMQQIITRFKKYPSKLSSVKTVIENVSIEDLF